MTIFQNSFSISTFLNRLIASAMSHLSTIKTFFARLSNVASFQHYRAHFEELLGISLHKNPSVIRRNEFLYRCCQVKIAHYFVLMIIFPHLNDTWRVLNYEYSYYSEKSFSRVFMWCTVLIHSTYIQYHMHFHNSPRLSAMNLKYFFLDQIPAEFKLMNHRIMRLLTKFMYCTQRISFNYIIGKSLP